MMVTVGKEYVV
ncbi:Protein of unknown function [Bacillus cytotoxicus]|uniref:Uncharacterized protein n=1 Tax=Bacillus cytotoxicus TaxID=580165 RepID=A0AAX2CEU1_9BACI|nr:Protein of unknown function [Bacillus cytotoxicus]SCN33999.1 Protein of unknown function [Bacillus cytotoxicus]